MQYRGTIGVFKNRKFTNKLEYKEISKLKFIQICYVADYFYIHSHFMVSYFMVLIAFLYLMPKVLKGVNFSAFVTFYVTCMHLRTVKFLYSIFLIVLNGYLEIKQGPRRSTDETFSILPLEKSVSLQLQQVVSSKSIYCSS